MVVHKVCSESLIVDYFHKQGLVCDKIDLTIKFVKLRLRLQQHGNTQ